MRGPICLPEICFNCSANLAKAEAAGGSPAVLNQRCYAIRTRPRPQFDRETVTRPGVDAWCRKRPHAIVTAIETKCATYFAFRIVGPALGEGLISSDVIIAISGRLPPGD